MNIINFAILHLHWKWHFNIRFAFQDCQNHFPLSQIAFIPATKASRLACSDYRPSRSLSLSAAWKNFQLLCAIAAT